jgi:GDPmannose 4,6-dehydratase
MQWLMLQQDEPEDYVIATGKQYSVRQFVEVSAARIGVTLRWQGQGVDEIGIVESVDPAQAATRCPAIKEGATIVRVDPRYFRPTEVETLLGNPAKAKAKLGWEPEITFEAMVEEMMEADLLAARKSVLIKNADWS